MKQKIKYIYWKITYNLKNVVWEDVRRLINKDSIFTITHNNIDSYFYLPEKRDSLQQRMIVDNTFREVAMLDQINSLLNKDSVVLDVGANIGNHTIYFANISKVKKVYSFEPQEYIHNILKKNVELNNLQNKVTTFNVGVGEKDTYRHVRIPQRRFLRAGFALASILDENGDTKIITLDRANIKEKVDLIKIDTEGYEPNVLIGARKLIEKDKPIVFVETAPNNIEFVEEYFKSLGYNKPLRMRRLPAADDLLFVHSNVA